jgi:hypothetical protein
MKKKILILMFSLFVVCVYAQQQNCYNTYRNKGVAAYNASDYTKAKEYFAEALSACVSSEIPANHDINSWIKKCDDAIAAAAEKERQRLEQLAQEKERQRLERLAQEKRNAITGLEISGYLAQRQIEREMDFIYLFWKFEDKNNGEVPAGKFKIGKDGKFTVKLPPKPLFLETCYSFFGEKTVINDADALLGIVSLFAYSSKFSDFSGDLSPHRRGLHGLYLYSDRDVNITGETSKTKTVSEGVILRLQLKKGWNSIVFTDSNGTKVMTTQEIPNDLRWDS